MQIYLKSLKICLLKINQSCIYQINILSMFWCHDYELLAPSHILWWWFIFIVNRKVKKYSIFFINLLIVKKYESIGYSSGQNFFYMTIRENYAWFLKILKAISQNLNNKNISCLEEDLIFWKNVLEAYIYFSVWTFFFYWNCLTTSSIQKKSDSITIFLK